MSNLIIFCIVLQSSLLLGLSCLLFTKIYTWIRKSFVKTSSQLSPPKDLDSLPQPIPITVGKITSLSNTSEIEALRKEIDALYKAFGWEKDKLSIVEIKEKEITYFLPVKETLIDSSPTRPKLINYSKKEE